MSGALPIACSLDATALGDRVAELTAVGRSALRSVRRDGARAELRFTPEAHDRLAAIVAAEAACCPFLRLDLDGGRLSIDGPPEAAPVIDDLVAAFTAEAGRLYRLLDARGEYRSPVKGQLGGNRSTRIYGRLDCRVAQQAIDRGGYVTNRVFFADAATAQAAGYRPCQVCRPDA